jgi:hypothetical protein
MYSNSPARNENDKPSADSAEGLSDDAAPTIAFTRNLSTSAIGATILGFGKHRGLRVDQTPSAYLRWMLASVYLEDRLRQEISVVLRSRLAGGIDETGKPTRRHERSDKAVAAAAPLYAALDDLRGGIDRVTRALDLAQRPDAGLCSAAAERADQVARHLHQLAQWITAGRFLERPGRLRCVQDDEDTGIKPEEQ